MRKKVVAPKSAFEILSVDGQFSHSLAQDLFSVNKAVVLIIVQTSYAYCLYSLQPLC